MGDKILSGIEEVASHLRIHPDTLRRYAKRFPPMGAGFMAILNGRWHVKATEIEAWLDYVKRQLHRHPDSRRLRPEEPPELTAIQGRTESTSMEENNGSGELEEDSEEEEGNEISKPRTSHRRKR